MKQASPSFSTSRSHRFAFFVCFTFYLLLHVTCVSRSRVAAHEIEEQPDGGGGGGGGDAHDADPLDLDDIISHRSKKLEEYDDDEDTFINELTSPSSTSMPNKKGRPFKIHWTFDDRYKFTKSIYHVSIPENAAGKTYAIVNISKAAEHNRDNVDLSSPYEKMGIYVSDPALVVRYKIIGGDDRKIFKAEGRHVGDFWFLRIRTRATDIAALNREYLDNYHLKVRATIISVRDETFHLKARCDVFVQVEDANDLNPLFYPTNYDVEIPEDLPVDSPVVTVSAFDPDIGMNGEIYYSLEPSESSADFAVHPTSGVITLTRALTDVNSDKSFNPRNRQLVVWALDRTSNLRDSSSGVSSVEALARRSGTALALRSRALVNINVIPIHNNHEDNSALATESNINAVDSVNSSPPQFKERLYSVRVREDFPVGTLVVRIIAHDVDHGLAGRIHYYIRRGNEDGKFFIDEDMGNIRIKKPLDFEKRPFYNLTIVAKDEGQPSLSSTTNLVIEIEDVDENRYAPKFPDVYATGHVKENSPNGTYVMTVLAIDEDAPFGKVNQLVTYQLVDGDGLGKFTLHPDGKIYTHAVFDRETSWRYWLTVVARDRAAVPKTSYIHVFIEIIDENDCAPVTLEPFYTASIHENASISTSVLQLASRDADLREDDYQFNYRIINEEETPFKIVKTTGLIQTKDKLDRETQSLYVLDVEISEANSGNTGSVLMSKTPVIIEVLDVNDNEPQIIQTIIRCQAYNSLPTNIPLCHVIAWDLDDIGNSNTTQSTSLHFNITEGNERNIFKFNETTGEIFFSHPNATIPKKTYELVVAVSDNGVPQRSSQALVIIKIFEPLIDQKAAQNETNSAPTFTLENQQDASFAVTENEAIGHIVTVLKTNDDDFDVQCTHIVSGNVDGTFALYQGAVRVARKIDFEQCNKYRLTLAVTDGIDYSYLNVTISVINTNDNLPHFTQDLYQVDVPESATKGSVILELSVKDSDANANHMFSIYSSDSPRTLDKFEIETRSGKLRVKETLDHEIVKQHFLVVEVLDSRISSNTSPKSAALTHTGPGSSPTASPLPPTTHRAFAVVRIDVIDVNDHAPRFTAAAYTSVISETSALGTSVLQVIATDSDSGSNSRISYALVSGNVNNTFGIEPTLGYIYVAKQLSVKLLPEYHLVVKATDHGEPPLSTYSVVQLMIVLPDNMPPRFEKRRYIFNVSENSKIGQVILSGVKAISKHSVLYSMQGGFDDMKHFGINMYLGEVFLRQTLDYEQKQRYEFNITATNLYGANDTAVVDINVRDSNDNAPFWNQTHFSGHISESAIPGSLVLNADNKPLQVQAYDIVFIFYFNKNLYVHNVVNL